MELAYILMKDREAKQDPNSLLQIRLSDGDQRAFVALQNCFPLTSSG